MDRKLFLYLHGLLYAYVLLGVLGAALVVDEFDEVRLLAFAYFGMPLLAVYTLFLWLSPGLFSRFRSLRPMLLLPMVLIYGGGVFALINAVSAVEGKVKQRQKYAYQGFVDSKQRGGFGILFRYRSF